MIEGKTRVLQGCVTVCITTITPESYILYSSYTCKNNNNNNRYALNSDILSDIEISHTEHGQ